LLRALAPPWLLTRYRRDRLVRAAGRLARAAADDATIGLVGQQFRDGRDQALAQFARGRQRLVCVSGNSHADATLAAVRRALAGQSLDLLLIDADHLPASVTRDFEQYPPLLRPGGLVAFHDIVPDHRKRFGKETGRDAGDVAEFWRALGDRYGSRHEFVHHPDQDGCDIGVLVWRWPA
jgi:predicted O-methyltransferase YrrM